MEEFSEKLKSLSHNKYFAIVALVFFAFLTALVLALITMHKKTPLVKNLQKQIDENSNNYRDRSKIDKPTDSITSDIDTIINKGSQTSKADWSQKKTDASEQTSSTADSGVATNDTISKLTQNAKPLPKVAVSNVTVSTALPDKPTEATIQQLKTSFSEEDVLTISDRLKLKQDVVDTTNKTTTVYDLTNPAFLSFDKSNGEFVFVSEKGLSITNTVKDPKIIASLFAKRIGLTQSCVEATATYVLKDEPNTTYVELHCTPEKLGLPIYDSYGVLNTPLYNKLSSYKVGQIDIATAPEDPNIISASDIAGYKRPDEYNTTVVQVDDKTGSVLTSYSNMRFIKNTISVPQSSILSPKQAIEEFEKNNTALTLTTPIGEGSIDLNAVYANDRAQADSATITDVALAFNGSPSLTTPADSCPQWFLRGTMNSKTGYELGFVSLVPAVNDKRCTSSVLGTSSKPPAQTNPAPKDIPAKLKPCDGSSSVKYCTFVFKAPTPTPYNTATPATQQPVGNCPAGINHAWKINDCEFMVWIDKNALDGNKILKARAWYWMVKPSCMNSFNEKSLSSTFKEKKSDLLKMRARTVMQKCKRGLIKQCPIDNALRQQLSGAYCQHLTTASPAIYVYTKHKQKINISIAPIGSVTFTNPALTNKASSLWSGVAYTDGTLKLSNNITKKWLYYEYNKTLLNQLVKGIDNQYGYIVSKDNLESFGAKLSKDLNLTKTEISNLLKEMERESIYVKGNSLKIQIIPQKNLESLLPLAVSPKPNNIYRYHFVLSKAKWGENITPPRLPIINRSGFTIVELGAASYK